MIPLHLDLALRAMGVVPAPRKEAPPDPPAPYVAWRPKPGDTVPPF